MTASHPQGFLALLSMGKGPGHWFFEPDRADACNQAAAEIAWQHTLEFLR